MSSVSELIAHGADMLKAAGVAEPRREASSILGHAIGRDRTFLITHDDYSPPADDVARFESMLARRAAREPLQYIIGRQEFFGLDFEVGPGVLIPRPETELIVEEAIRFLGAVPTPAFCEIGVGSGCISVALLKNLPTATAIGGDVSPEALATARRNADRHGVGDRLELIESDVFSSIGVNRKFDAIVSNPPYVAESDISGLQPEVRDHEPRQALTDGADGLSIVRRIIESAPEFLCPGGLILIEIGFGQADSVARFADERIWSEIGFLDDLQSIPRTFRAVLK